MSDFFSAERPPKRVLIIKLRHHGDVLLTSPVFTVLKKNWPNDADRHRIRRLHTSQAGAQQRVV
ncbi:hypothetical protein QVH39_00540 [Enterobacter pseudoroggenkampii]|nr:hypothetical protein [Enterobacter pseudoroggenkampii]WJW86163.1 hypothetical protein QVH39_00540 [Enterobacter pseudoroggenkampii]